MKTVRVGAVVNKIAPELDRRFVRNEFTLAGIFQKGLADRAVSFQAAKNIAARAVEKIWDGAENFALGSFAGARSAKQKDRAEFHGASLCFNWISFISENGFMIS